MKKYYAEIEYYKSTMDTPWCLVTGEREVSAYSEHEARELIIREAQMRGIDNIDITKIKVK